MLNPDLDGGREFLMHNNSTIYRVRQGSYRENGTILVQRWDQQSNDWLSEGRMNQEVVLQLIERILPFKPLDTVITDGCAACEGKGSIINGTLPGGPVSCSACNGTGKRTSVSTVGRDVKKDNPLSERKVGRPKARLTARPDMDRAPDMSTKPFKEVLSALDNCAMTQKQLTDELEITPRQAYHYIYWLRAAGYITEEVEDGVRGRLFSVTSKGSKFLAKIQKTVKK